MHHRKLKKNDHILPLKSVTKRTFSRVKTLLVFLKTRVELELLWIRSRYRKRTLKIAVIKYFQNDTFESVTVVFLIQLFSLTVISKQKLKMKTWKTIALSYQSTSVLLKIRESHFSLVWLIQFSIVSTCLGEVKNFFLITLTW